MDLSALSCGKHDHRPKQSRWSLDRNRAGGFRRVKLMTHYLCRYEAFVIPYRQLASKEPDRRHDGGDDQHGHTNQYPPQQREHSDMPPGTPRDGEIPALDLVNVLACVARVVLVGGFCQHVCGNSEPLSLKP